MCIAQNASSHIWPLAQLINKRDGGGAKVKSHKKCRERRLGRTMARGQDDSDCRRKGFGNQVSLILLLTEQFVHGKWLAMASKSTNVKYKPETKYCTKMASVKELNFLIIR